MRIGEDLNAAPRNTTVAHEGSVEEVRKEVRTVTLPAYGSMLPVRSLGVLYTLRSGGLARFELTRDVEGKGWTMPRGTVLVGALRGAEYDRASSSCAGVLRPSQALYSNTRSRFAPLPSGMSNNLVLWRWI